MDTCGKAPHESVKALFKRFFHVALLPSPVLILVCRNSRGDRNAASEPLAQQPTKCRGLVNWLGSVHDVKQRRDGWSLSDRVDELRAYLESSTVPSPHLKRPAGLQCDFAFTLVPLNVLFLLAGGR